MKYELTEANVKDLIEWLRGGHVNRAVIALEHLAPVAAIEKPEQDMPPCPRCGKDEGYMVRECTNCGEHFIIEDAPSPQAPAQYSEADCLASEARVENDWCNRHGMRISPYRSCQNCAAEIQRAEQPTQQLTG